MGKRKIKAAPEKAAPVIKERDMRKFWISGISLVVGVILLVFLVNYQYVPYWFGKTDPVAKVNGTPITGNEAKTMLLLTGVSYKTFTGKSFFDQTDDDIKSFKGTVLDDLMKTHAEEQQAEKQGLKLTSAELAKAEKSFETDYASMQSQSSDDLKSGFLKLNLSEDVFKAEDKKFTIANALIDKLKTHILKEDYVKTLKSSDFERITVREIWIDVTKHKDAQAKKLIDEIYGKYKAGTSFKDLVQEYKKDDFNAENNGLIGTIGRNIMPAEFDKVAFSIKPGEVSEPIKTRLGYHILLVDKHTYADVNNISEDLYNDILASDKFKAYYDNLANKWNKKADKKKFVENYK